ncbi:MAG: class I SAM-dependent methyltransferase [Nitrospirae bacterium]|nr:class I SAM-dependent methyltransferase [Nitrospirota bacterium]
MMDATVRERETRLICRFVGLVLARLIRDGRKEENLVLCDMGCGNGLTLHVLSEEFPGLRFVGLEYTPEMMEVARARFGNSSRVSIEAGDVRRLSGCEGRFDFVLGQRVLINVLDPAEQRQALQGLARTLKPGGFMLGIEAFEDALVHLNEARSEFGLPPILPPHHNRYLPVDFYRWEHSLEPLTGPGLDPSLPADFLPSNFLSNHYYIARVLHPLALGPEARFDRNSHFVRFLTSSLAAPVGDYAPIKAFCFRKRIA